MEQENQPSPMQADQAFSGDESSSDEQGQHAYDYEGRKKSFVPPRTSKRGATRGLELKDRVKKRVEEDVEGHGRVVSYPVFTIEDYKEDLELGWVYQLFDIKTKELHRGGQYFEEAKLKKERPKPKR